MRRRRTPARSTAVAGDTAAFAEVYRRHHQALYRYCRSIVHHDEDAHDALQSTFEKAMVALSHEQRDFELRPWLFRIAHNEAISILRRRRPAEPLDAARDVGLDTLARDIGDRQRLAQLREDLADLSERQRQALVLRELSGLGHEEIAAVLECSSGAVKQTIFEARTALNEYAEGRAMTCEAVQQLLSDGDRRVLRGRRVRAHLRDCRCCRGFRDALSNRPRDLAVLAPPLPLGASAAPLGQLLGGAQAAGVATGSATGGAGAGV